jgi:hypothetical protein
MNTELNAAKQEIGTFMQDVNKNNQGDSFCQSELANLQKFAELQGGSNMTETDLCVNKPHCAAAVRP